MITHKGFPRCNGSTDFCDSAVLAGLLAVFKWPMFIMPSYFDKYGNPIRSNESNIEGDECFNPVSFSRDQLTPLIAGYYSQELYTSCEKLLNVIKSRNWLCPNNDILSPSQRGHLKYCAGINPSWLEDKWLYLDILYSAFVQPMAEPNQLICMLMVREKKFLKTWTKLNKYWRDSIREYWCEAAGAWRNEPELASFMIEKIEERTKGE